MPVQDGPTLFDRLVPGLAGACLEERFASQGHRVIAGVDEAGRGPLAGPVVAAAVVLRPGHPADYLKDSKVLSEKARERAFWLIMREARFVGVGLCSPGDVDRLNIRQATLRAMGQAIERLEVFPDLVLLDGVDRAPLARPVRQEPIKRGDGLGGCMSAASIVAKVVRDRIMRAHDLRFPAYGFARHKGYGTRAHLAALEAHGPCAIHRLTFRGVRPGP